MKTCICTVGYPGAGKTAAQKPAKERGIPVVVMGNRVRGRALSNIPDSKLEKAEASDVNPSKSDLIGEWATEQREVHGDAVVAEWTVEYVENRIESDTVLVDGMRSIAERDVFENAFENVVVLFVEASFETRLRRLQNRGRDGEDAFSAKDLEERDGREDEWGVAEVIKTADTTITNESTVGEFHEEVGAFLDGL